MVQKTTSQLSQPHSIHRQIMRRVTVVVVVVFALLLTAALALISSQSQNASGLDAELTVRESQVIQYLQTPIREIEQIAHNELTLSFATGAQGIRSADGAAMIPATLRDAQGQMLQQFLTVNNTYPGQYLGMRYIALATNSVWTEVTVQNGITASNTDFQFGAYAESPIILDVRSRGSAVFLDTLGSQTTSRGVIQPVLRLYAPVRNPDVFNATLGLIEFELRAQPLINLINEASIRFGEETTPQRWLLVNNQGQYLADSSQTDIFVQSVQADSFPTLAMNDSAIAGALSASEPVENVQAGNKTVSSRQISLGNAADMPWTLVVVADRNAVPAVRALLVVVTVVICAAGATGTIWFTNRTLRQRLQPLETVSSLAVKLATGNIYDTLLPVKGGNSLGELVEAFERISLRMQDLTEEIQSQDQQITQKLELAAEISQKAAALSDTDLLLQEMVDLICGQLGYYHAQVFLLDNVNLQAILRHSHGVIGEQLLREHYTVPVDADTFVGQVVNSGQAVVITYKDEPSAIHDLPPHLNKTRTQIAVPIRTGDAILGVLDIHSVEMTAKRRDVYTLQMLADQSAVMIKTARELATTQEKLERSERLNRQYTQHAWADTREKHALKDIYTYDLQDVHVTQRESTTTASLSLPISVRGEVIGTIDAAPPTGQPFTEGDTFLLRAVADRVAMVIENARLFNETQSNLNLTQQLYDLSSSLSKADNLEAIIQAILESVVQDASSGQIWHFDEETDDNSRWLELKALWSKNTGEAARHRELLKLRLPLSASPFLQTLQGDRVKLVSDTEQDFRMDNHLKGLLRLLGVRAVAVVPYTTRGNWRGVLMIGFPHIREFPPQESRIYAALIDQAGIMIDNRMLSEDQERLLDEAQRLYAGSRNISSAQNSMDLIRAVVPVARDSRTNFQLALLEGALDDTGWPTVMRIVASSEGAQITEKNEVHPLQVALESPLRNREAEIQFRDEGSPRFQAIFPLFSANQPIALFSITNDFVRDLDSQDYEIFLSLTGQMSTVIENRRLLERTTRALDETQQLYKATQAIIGAADINGVYQMAAQYIASWAYDASRITILQAGPMPSLDAAYLDYVYVWDRHKQRGSFQPGMRVSTEATLLTTIFQESRDTRYISDIETTFANEQRLRLALQQGGANSLIAASVQSGQKWFGMLICEALEVDAFNERLKPFIQAVADQVGIAVENRQLFEEARLEAQRALALAEVGQLATRIGADFEQSLTEAFERIAQPTNYDRWLVMLRNETAPDLLEEVISHTAPGFPRWEGLMIDLETAEHSLADAVRFNQSIIVNDPSKYLAFLGLAPDEMRAWGKHIVTPIHIGKRDAGVILVGRSLDSVDIGQHDEQLVVTLAAQVAVAVENRRLFQEAANEREYLGSILQTMPTGVIVLDGRTLKPIRSNQQAELLLGSSIALDQPFNSEIYNLFRLDTYTPYPVAELPVVRARETGKPQFASDLVTFRNNERIDLLLNAAPIHDNRGGITAIVAAFQDISTLRTLEGELQNRLQESQALYEAIRTLANATSLDMVLDAVIAQISQLDVVNGYVILLDKLTGDLDVKRAVYPVSGFDLPFELLERTPRFIPNVTETDVLDADTKDLLSEQGVHSVSSLPLWSRETLLGWVVLSHDRLPRIADYENLLTAIGDNAATAVDNHLLFLDTQESYLEAASLYEISRTLARATTPQDVVNAVVNYMHRDHIHRILMMEVVSSDINEQVGSVRVAVNWQQDGIAEINMLDVSLSPEQFPNWRHVAASSIVTIDDVSQALDLNDIERASFLSLDIASLAVLPLYGAQQPLGVLWLVSSAPYRHTERDLRLYGAFMEQAALSLGSVQLLRQTERRARQLALSAEVTQAASSILALDDLLPSVVDQIKDAFHFDHVQIFLMDEDHNYAVLRASTGEAGKKLLGLGHKLQKGSISVIGQVT
ncbi:MAG: GAF domain-containing protein, partial [Anaerolineae bacterium]|nr:GAF domain-containing protein [Anaerolineae bacterium]